MKALHVIAWILLVIGGLNWGLVGIADFNIVSYLGSTLEMIVYILVGLAALVSLFTHKKHCRTCSKNGKQKMDQTAMGGQQTQGGQM